MAKNPEGAGPSGGRVGVLFVCAGNICRSPLAEGIFLHQAGERKALERFAVDSAGTGNWHAGAPPDRRSIAVARQHGVVLPSFARQVKPADFHDFQWILCMDEENLENLRPLCPGERRNRLRLIRSFDPTAEAGAEVPDPYYGELSHFENVYAMLDRACAGLLEVLLRPGSSQPR